MDTLDLLAARPKGEARKARSNFGSAAMTSEGVGKRRKKAYTPF